MRLTLSRAAASVLLFAAPIWAASAALSPLRSQRAAVAQTAKPQDLIPFDEAVRRATLPNGLTYFIRQNSQPDQRVSLRLAVKVGSLAEADDQQGLAHFIEHMAFNGSAHFRPGELVSYFESTGTRLGPHVNAYTGFDETVYMFELPTDQPEILARGLTALADFAGGLALNPAEVDKERGVVVEEWRGGLGAGSRLRDQQTPFLYYRSRYARRLPIGKPDVVRTAPAARLRSFYDTWYRPDRMALVAVGDIDPPQIEAAIRTAFGGLAARGKAGRPPDSSVPLHGKLLANVATDPEVTSSSVSIVWKHPRQSELHVRDYRRSLVERLVERMLNERLGELARKPGASFLSAGAGSSTLGPKVATFSIRASVQDGGIESGLSALAVEAKRLRELGFGPSELDRAKRSMLAFYERAHQERDKTESASFAQEYLNHFLDDEPSPGIEYEYRLVQQVLPDISTSDVSAAARSLLADGSRVLLAVSPQKSDIRVPSEAGLQVALASARRVAVTPWNDTMTARGLMERKPEPVAVISRQWIENVDVTVVGFANGVQAWLKPTTFKNDQVLFSMDAPGGASLASPEDYAEASLASAYVTLGGVGGLQSVELQKLLAGKLAAATPFMALSTHGISGSSSPAEIETALQLLYLAFTAPSDDPDAFRLLARQLSAAVANREQNPTRVFGERVSQVNTSNHYTSEPMTPARVASLDRSKMSAFYHERFSNAADFTFFMVGAFRVDEVVPLLARYLGSLPSSGRPSSQFKDVAIRFPASVERVSVEKGQEPRSQAVISFFADPPPNSADQEGLAAATTVLDIALRDLLREDLGQTYNVSVGLLQPLPQRGAGRVSVSFAAAPGNIQAMVDRVLQEVTRLQQEGPSADLTARAKEAARRNDDLSLTLNGYWLRRLQLARLYERDPFEILQRKIRIDAVTEQTVRDMFRRYFPLDRHTVVTLVPVPKP